LASPDYAVGDSQVFTPQTVLTGFNSLQPYCFHFL